MARVEQLDGLDAKERPYKEQKLFLQNALVAHVLAFIIDKAILGSGLNPDGRRLLRIYARRTWRGEKVSIAKEVSRLLDYSELSIEVSGEQNIPTSGPTIFVANHVKGGPLRNVGQFFKMVQVGYDERSGIQDDYIREPFLIIQRGLARHAIGKLSGLYFDVVGEALGCEIVEIPRFRKDENGDGERIVNHQRLKKSAVQRIVAGGASVWMPQARERTEDDFNFPFKGNRYIRKIAAVEPYTQITPICSIPDSRGNLKLVFGKAVDIKDVIANGGIQDFALRHIAPLKQSGL